MWFSDPYEPMSPSIIDKQFAGIWKAYDAIGTDLGALRVRDTVWVYLRNRTPGWAIPDFDPSTQFPRDAP